MIAAPRSLFISHSLYLLSLDFLIASYTIYPFLSCPRLSLQYAYVDTVYYILQPLPHHTMFVFMPILLFILRFALFVLLYSCFSFYLSIYFHYYYYVLSSLVLFCACRDPIHCYSLYFFTSSSLCVLSCLLFSPCLALPCLGLKKAVESCRI